MSSPSRLFVFEVEDVLVDATELVGEAVDQFIQERFGEALDPFTLEIVKEFGLKQLADYIHFRFGFAESISEVMQMIQHRINSLPTGPLPLCPGALQLVQRLTSVGVPVAIISQFISLETLRRLQPPLGLLIASGTLIDAEVAAPLDGPVIPADQREIDDEQLVAEIEATLQDEIQLYRRSLLRVIARNGGDFSNVTIFSSSFDMLAAASAFRQFHLDPGYDGCPIGANVQVIATLDEFDIVAIGLLFY